VIKNRLFKSCQTDPLSNGLTPPSGKFSRETPIFYLLYRPHRAPQSSEGRISKLHTVLEIRARNPILETYFFRVRRISHSQIFEILWGVCALQNGMTSDRLTTLQRNKKVKTCLLSKRLAPYSGKFSKNTPNFLHTVYRPRRAIQSCEGEILKFHTVLEILVKNPKLTTHFFRGSKMFHFQVFDTG